MGKFFGFYKFKSKGKRKRPSSRQAGWAVKIVVLTFILSLISSVLSQVAVGGSDILIATMLLIFMVITSIIFDVIGVSVTSCSLCRISAADDDDEVTVTARMLIDNAEKVNNLCADVIGDICGVMSGACGASIVAAISEATGADVFLPSILVSAVIASVTVGGKAFCKKIAVVNSESIVLFAARRIRSVVKLFKRK